MAAASPKPFAPNYDSFNAQPISRLPRYPPARPYLKRGSPLSYASTLNAAPQVKRQFSVGDSSDDEVPVPPMKFSAEAKAILGDEASVMDSSPRSQKDGGSVRRAVRLMEDKQLQRPNPPTFQFKSRERTASPAMRTGSPRIVRLNTGSAGSTGQRTASRLNRRNSSELQKPHNIVTPAPQSRDAQSHDREVRLEDRSSEAYRSRYEKPSSGHAEELIHVGTDPNTQANGFNEVAVQMGNLSISRSKPEETVVQGSLRVKRVGKVTGRYLSGPARRGMKRRQSEEDQSPIQEGSELRGTTQNGHEAKGDNRENVHKDEPLKAVLDSNNLGAKKSGDNHPPSNRQPLLDMEAPVLADENILHPSIKVPIPARPKSPISSKSDTSTGKRVQPVFKVPPLPVLPSRFDQENEPPPTFRRNKSNGLALLDKVSRITDGTDRKMLIATPATESPKRQPLGPRSQNTPMRPAPPPPKMTVLETATATGGAAASASRKRRNHMVVNGKSFMRMERIGKGGSCSVYRVMAENYKVFALKRVSFENVDPLAVRGYKIEIDLLKKLEKVDRVVTMYDYEINDERQSLSVLMEEGESDLEKILRVRLNAENATIDPTFTRYFWQEMLECVRAVHAHDIVHSDLKPANFLLVKGRLKLIDFGIANAIQDDTINVHREVHVGTPNYMSPEAVIDTNAPSSSSVYPSDHDKMMKLGRPSDIWSLGCILYQMTYSKPPFAHITNPMHRLAKIADPRHIIEFPTLGLGATPVPTSLIRTLKRCLNRDPVQRPTVEELLSTGDPFLFPDATAQTTVPVNMELLARLQNNIIKHVKEKGMPTELELETWPRRFFVSIKAAVEEGRA